MSKCLLLIRSILFNLLYLGWSLLASIILVPYFIISTPASMRTGKPWASVILWLARVICGIRYEVRGREHISKDAVIYASKHQSAWDTVIFWMLMKEPTFVLKRELLRIPLWGWYLWRMQMIAIDRSGGASAMKHLIQASKKILAMHRPIIIFPEGTRMRPGSPPNYQPGITALYSTLKTPVVPVALNSGKYWGKNSLLKRPGTIIIEFLPAIPPGLKKDVFMQELQTRVEDASTRLLHES
ncbi:MAG: lysophospholipid acyltransferase family protein [Rickettsiales bacterium]|nr:lysophospholipid acyltransferase family protein [Rickettsiales bacterium]